MQYEREQEKPEMTAKELMKKRPVYVKTATTRVTTKW